MNRPVRPNLLYIPLISALLGSAFSLISPPHALADTKGSLELTESRFERVKGEIESFKKETEATLTQIREIQENTRCLGSVYTVLNGLNSQLEVIGERGTVASVAQRTRDLVKKHAEYFDALNEFSKQGSLLIGNLNLASAGKSEEIFLIVRKATDLIQTLREKYQLQAGDEVRFLSDVSTTMQRFQNAGYVAKRSLENTQRCAPHLLEKQMMLLDLGSNVLNNLGKARALIAELQLKRSRVLGALTSVFQKKISAQIAKASSQKIDEIVAQMSTSLAELSLRSEVERWWFIESLEKGPARGFLSEHKENASHATENLRLAIANCDNFIARVRDIYSSPNFIHRREKNDIHSDLEISLYQRREALSRWNEQANRLLTMTDR